MILLEVIYVLICLLMVVANALLIQEGKRIYHGINGAIHVICWLTFFWLTHSWIVLSLPFIGRLFFDVLLSIARKLPVSYVPLKPKSIIDKIEKWIFKDNGLAPKIIYFWIIVLINVVYYFIYPI